ncbi:MULTISPECIES: RrF2 family transcriptional regulator [Dethiosulfovibrio]|jgi:Rrf2 family protein|uniref:Transcriptional regulator, BadM/Rrf2 family n=3 Tax=Dethiosulfovibrio TaxID=47054 RepID=D2Z2K7_9BACT|nr:MULTISPECIES: Rrf2 family transcriptional regulator [Dethiosulfovibrio]MEA3284002.1 Rrf2 family transcriptional regulator [Synergistota bacterium]EFC90163.1 transcriptional regulator, BadM/Rrf2 family [Dethiosulfovibrio peptidovorans DSM 11002]MCF4113826.1 Rrf2 family transcriptional regulator [Dethiosulfovibrio russensis]MCF4141761.1 Rrf2 family transcriptional regulator [Dethiosulfovibrio marinus]MCF4143822.1 Rrf2 family transcriptional regulator [Dethiosulfovibrio acidaminovorans]
MKLSTKTRYGLRAMIDLARGYGTGRPISISEVAKNQTLSESYLEQLFSKLRKSGLVSSVRGAQGGYLLSRDPKEILTSEIIDSLEGPISLADCVDYGTCERGGCCPARFLWEKVSDSIERVTSSTTLWDIIEEYDRECTG